MAEGNKNRYSTASSSVDTRNSGRALMEEEPPTVTRVFKAEVKEFWNTRTITSTTWTTFILLNIANVLMLVWFLAPGWSWSLETGSNPLIEGTYYGYWGIWYSCWELVDELDGNRMSCTLTTEIYKDYFDEFWVMAQGLSICILVLGLAAFGLMCLYMCNRQMSGNFWLVLIYDIIIFLVAAMNISMSVAFAIEYYHIMRWECCDPEHGHEILDYHLWYAYIISCVSAILYLAAGIAAVFEALNIKKEQRIRRMYEEFESRRASHPYSLDEASQDRMKLQALGYYPQMMMQNPQMAMHSSQGWTTPR